MTLSAADANLGRIVFERETTFGALNSPFNGQIARVTNDTLTGAKETAVSNELRSDRMIGGSVEVGFSTSGDLGMELSADTHSDMLESALCGTYDTATAFVGAVTITAATQTVDATGAFTNLVVGNAFLLGGMTNATNDGWHIIATRASADSVTVVTAVADLTDETSAGTATIDAIPLRNGVVKRSYNLERYLTDVDMSSVFLGQRLGTFNISVRAGSIVTGGFTFQGLSVQTQDPGAFSTTPSAATTTEGFNATTNVAIVRVGGVKVPCLVQSLDLSLDNTLRPQAAISNKYPCGIGYGRQMVTGDLSLYFEDYTVYDQFLAHSDVSIEFGFTDAAGNGLHFYIPTAKLLSDSGPTLDGVDSDVMENIGWQAEPGSNAYQIQVTAA